MKNLINLMALLFLSNFLQINNLHAQKSFIDFSLDLDRTIQLAATSEIKEIKVECLGRNKYLHLMVSSNVSIGALKIEIIDPSGKVQEKFNIESSITMESLDNKVSFESLSLDKVSGKISKTFENPEKGNWIIKAIPQKVYGNITVNSQQTNIPIMH